MVLADDEVTADQAYRWACEGTALLWTGDFHNARQLLQALARRQDRAAGRTAGKAGGVLAYPEAFHLYRKNQAQRSRILGMVLLPLSGSYQVPLRRAPDLSAACEHAYGPAGAAASDSWVSLREVQGLIGAYEWHRKGVPVPALGLNADGEPRRIHPRHGVFSPVRGEYLELLKRVAWPGGRTPASAFDIGTGSGVIAAVLAARGVPRVMATDLNPQAITCARDNAARLGLGARVEVLACDLFPPGRAPLVVCNPPWLPGKPATAIEQGIYDPQSRMLRAFLAGLPAHLEAGGQGWLILSDLAEHLGLRSREELLAWIAAAGLAVAGREDIRPAHAKSTDRDDPLHTARRAEITSLWRLVVA